MRLFFSRTIGLSLAFLFCLTCLPSKSEARRRAPLLRHGQIIALYSLTHKRFVRMNNKGRMDTSQVWHNSNVIHGKWTWERFKVVNGGNGLIGLYSLVHKRFVRMNNKAGMDTSQRINNSHVIHGKWTWERFKVVDGGRGTIGFYSMVHKRFIRMNNKAGMDTSQKINNHYVIHGKWTWERFKVLHLNSRPKPRPVVRRLPDIRWTSSNPGKAGLVRAGFRHCVQIREPRDPATWHDNWLCSRRNLGMRWSYAGPIRGMRCIQVNESAEPAKHAWRDNYLCLPRTSKLQIRWTTSFAGKRILNRQGFKRCVRMLEVADPHTWNDNFICYK